MESIAEFVKERDKALFSMDKNTIIAYFNKRGLPYPKNETVFWAVIHKCICHDTNASPELRMQSVTWLLDHGLTPEIYD